MFAPLPDDFSYPNIEQEVLDFWHKERIFDRSLLDREGSPHFTFYEGPPTVNGKPGLHHLIARTLKDMMCRYKTMRGYYVPRRAGWDTHGLPVEIAVEKELGLTQKNQIDSYGVDRFNAACKTSVYRNIDMAEGWRSFTERTGYWIDLDSAYITCTNEYIESVWWALKQFFDKGLIYRGFRIVPQSPTIETPLSSHELSQGYKEVKDPNCYIKLKVLSSPLPLIQDAELLVWTTTPWTLISNTALAVGEDIEYVLVRNIRTLKQGNDKVQVETKLVLASARLGALDGETEILATFQGSEILGTVYEQIFPYVRIDRNEFPNALTVLPGTFVSTADGSGIVHLAPAFGADDYEMLKKYTLPFLQPVTPGGRFTDEAGEFAGRTVKTFTYPDRTEEGADKDIVIALKKLDKIYRSSNDYVHSYPHCWRTDNPIIYYARESWFINSPAYKDRMIELNKEIEWQPAEIGSGRFGNWLEDVKEWNISRDRYWGTPLPIWVSDDKEDMFAIGSIVELLEGWYENPDGSRVPVAERKEELDLHRPFVDKIVFERDGKTFRRTHEIIDVWFDSGSMPFAQFHYPFENKELFEQSFPADFIAEGIDQTRGWFYTLHNIATALFDKPAFKSIIVNEMVLDKNGQKMSKSRRNTVDPFDIMDKYGADAIRWYLMVNNPPWRPTLFNEEDIRNTVLADFFRTLRETYKFFALYANIDELDGTEEVIALENRQEIDRWIISKLHSTMTEYQRLMDALEVTRACRLVQEFAVNDVSNWYVRRNRRRFWKGDRDSEKLAAYQTLRETMLGIVQMTAPVAPFLSEYLYQRLRTRDEVTSIHLVEMTQPDESTIDADLERRMARAQLIVFLARSLRERSRIKTRQPLRRLLIPVRSIQERRDIQAVESIIAEEVNVKGIEYMSDDTGIVRKSVKPNFKVLGRKFGKETQQVATFIRTMDTAQVARLETTGSINFTIDGTDYTVDAEDVEITSEDIEGWLVASQNGTTVALDTEIDDALRSEGTAREIISRIQTLRKESGFDVTDRISAQYEAPESIRTAVVAMRDYICAETLCTELTFVSGLEGTALDINDQTVVIQIAKV